ncbi:hypothetical protein [Pseudomonas sp.]|jgi:hypothetical protein|uniref:hypothetical protein n=1 Tax=Pseudomonas sp. TaxID=306 RepID=UPI0037C6F829
MDEITPLSSDPVPDLQRSVQRKLGRCMLQLQQYERLLKVMVVDSELSGPPERLQAIRDEKVACAHKKTLGTLVGMLTESTLKLSEPSAESKETEADNGEQSWVSFRYHREVSEE